MAKYDNNDKENKRQNDPEHSHAAVRHHEDEGGTYVPSLDEMPQSPVHQPNRSDYDKPADMEKGRKWGVL